MSRRSIERREFLRLTAAGVSVAGTYPLFLGKTAGAAGALEDDDRVLVVIQLSGGNDGLSTVVPYSDPAYARARRTTRIGEEDVLKIDDRVGFHPNLAELKDTFDAGEMAVVQGVSYPNPSRSHFESMDVWHAADRGGARRGSGWIGRAVDSTCGNRLNPLDMVNLGGKIPLALAGEKSKPVALGDPASYRWRGTEGEREAYSALNSAAEPAPEKERMEAPVRQLDYLRRVAAAANESSAAIRRAVESYRTPLEYPRANRFAGELRMVAAMVAAGLPARVYYVSLGGFDTHAGQRPRHDNLMRTFSQGVAAFLSDLRRLRALGRTLLLTFSEFGRRVQENGSQGTDHGVAAPMFLFGKKVAGGIHGEHPSLDTLVKGDLAMTADFRRAYASVLDGWLGCEAAQVLGESYEPLPVLRSGRVRVF